MLKRKVLRVKVGDWIAATGVLTKEVGIPVRTERAAEVARWFGLGKGSGAEGSGTGVVGPKAELTIIAPAPGTVTYLSGPSGAGKSTLLRAMREKCDGREWIDMNAIELPDVPLVDCFGDTSLQEVLMVLARVGLGEAWSYLRTPSELSDGQRWRLKLAMTLDRARDTTPHGVVLACDEFGAVLDRITAMIVARCLRRAIDANPHLCAVVATSHDDLEPALRPDLIGWCDFGKVEWRSRERRG